MLGILIDPPYNPWYIKLDHIQNGYLSHGTIFIKAFDMRQCTLR
jgi:hypothetical protein